MRDESRLLGESPEFMQVLEKVSRIAPLNKPVLVVGERGTGKELIAERLHYLSERWEAPFLKVNCAALSESLLESELFGHEPGAFTGATKVHHGRFERADSGTLFLDELATTSDRVQEQLLRVIEYGEFERLGGHKTLTTNVRLVAATNEDLPARVAAGTFRADLLDRLAFDVITLPPLRVRTDDIMLLANHFAINMSSQLDRDLFAGFTERAMATLQAWPWPGNVRELKNCIERSVYQLEDEQQPIDDITLDPFTSPWRLRAQAHASSASAKPADTAPDEQPELDGTAQDKPSITLPMDFKAHIQDYEIALLRQALNEGKFNQRKTAELLSLTYHQLRGYLRKYDLLEDSKASQD